MSKTDSFAIVHFPYNPGVAAEDILHVQFDASTTTIKTADLTYEGHGTKSSDLCGVLGFVDEEGHIHLTSNFDVYHMRPKLTDFNLTIEKTTEEETKLNRTDLDEKFGSEKSRRSVHSKKRNAIETEVLHTAVSAAREQVLNTTNEQMNESSFDGLNVSSIDDNDEQTIVPKPNYEAEKPEDAFNLENIISENDLLLLVDKCHPIVDATKDEIQKWSKEGTYPTFICDQMKKLPVEHGARVQAATKILYLHYLIVFLKRSMFKRLSGKPFPDDAPRPLQDKALQTYAVTTINERTRKQDNTVPPRLRLKLTAHICILALYIARFTVDMDTLRLSLGASISMTKIQDIYSELGCKIMKVVQTNVAVLEIPIKKRKLTDSVSNGSNRKRKRTT